MIRSSCLPLSHCWRWNVCARPGASPGRPASIPVWWVHSCLLVDIMPVASYFTLDSLSHLVGRVNPISYSTSSVHKALDMIDVYGCGSGGSANTKKTLGMALTPTTAPVAGPGGPYDGDAPTYVPPTTPGAVPRNRLKWLRPQDAVGRVLGVNAGPAANPTADWAQIEASFFTQLRLWQRHQLSRDGALYILSTHVFSRTWFLARYRPPSPQLVKRLDSAAVKYFWKRSLGDSGAGMALAAFRVGHRVKRSMLAMDHQLGGVLWFRTEHILCAVHAGMVITWMAPIAPNMRMGEARWQTTGHVAICAALHARIPRRSYCSP